MLRKINAATAMIVLVMFIIHGVLGAYNMMGIGHITMKRMAWVMVGFICIHVLISTCLTVQTLVSQKRAGTWYPKENRLFWARRISGFVIMILIFFHVTAFSGATDANYRLPDFDGVRLALQILLVLSIGFHVVTNARPMLLAFGISGLKKRTGDIAFWISILLVFMAAGFIIYFLRWRAI